MVDVVPATVRSRMMSGIRSKDTNPELIVRRALFASGYRFRLHRKDLPGSPDIVMQGRRVAIFVHGCFWHAHQGCKYAKTPSTRTEFWSAKLQANVDRDQRAADKLREIGWRVLYVWECSTRDLDAVAKLPQVLRHWVDGDEQVGEISAAVGKS
ncbi:very short patch repair endonuclease [Pelomonas sp. KK5]|uniref:very short patch repair endonuclease n=1 Tax=Pelomonas sp. KK5 TaxID=1855730 RepID=UPI00097C325B|nr:DNA mismatch endonuclease Vsr [Pelomonas sp. KK5]